MRVDSLIQGFGLLFVGVTFTVVLVHLCFSDLSLYETLCQVATPDNAKFINRDDRRFLMLDIFHSSASINETVLPGRLEVAIDDTCQTVQECISLFKMEDDFICFYDPEDSSRTLVLKSEWVKSGMRVTFFFLIFCALCGHLCYILGLLSVLTGFGVKFSFLSTARCDVPNATDKHWEKVT